MKRRIMFLTCLSSIILLSACAEKNSIPEDSVEVVEKTDNIEESEEIINSKKEDALMLMNEGELNEAISIFEEISNRTDVSKELEICKKFGEYVGYWSDSQGKLYYLLVSIDPKTEAIGGTWLSCLYGEDKYNGQYSVLSSFDSFDGDVLSGIDKMELGEYGGTFCLSSGVYTSIFKSEREEIKCKKIETVDKEIDNDIFIHGLAGIPTPHYLGVDMMYIWETYGKQLAGDEEIIEYTLAINSQALARNKFDSYISSLTDYLEDGDEFDIEEIEHDYFVIKQYGIETATIKGKVDERDNKSYTMTIEF